MITARDIMFFFVGAGVMGILLSILVSLITTIHRKAISKLKEGEK